MPYGQHTYGEAAYGEGVSAVAGGAVDGTLHCIEAADRFILLGNIPVISVSSVAQEGVLVFLLEIELAIDQPVAEGDVYAAGIYDAGIY